MIVESPLGLIFRDLDLAVGSFILERRHHATQQLCCQTSSAIPLAGEDGSAGPLPGV
jgi:hypothetical protein